MKMLFTGFLLSFFILLSASKVILPLVTTTINSSLIPLCIHGLVKHYSLPLYYTKDSTQAWVNCESNPHWQTHAETHTYFTFIINSATCQKYTTYLRVKYFAELKRQGQCRRTLCKWKDAFSESRFGVVELSLTSRGRAGTQQEKQRVGQGKFLPGSHECLNTTGMHKWNLRDCHDNYW